MRFRRERRFAERVGVRVERSESVVKSAFVAEKIEVNAFGATFGETASVGAVSFRRSGRGEAVDERREAERKKVFARNFVAEKRVDVERANEPLRTERGNPTLGANKEELETVENKVENRFQIAI